MLYKPNNKRVFSTREFNSINPQVPEVITNYVPVPTIRIKPTADIESTFEFEYGLYKLIMHKLTDGNVTTTMYDSIHRRWTVTTNYEDARSIYNYYLKGWK